MDIIDLLTEMEQIDLLRSQKITGSMRKLVQALCELYETLSSLIAGSPASSEQLHGTIPFALACRYELLMAITMAFRGHLSNSYHFTRRAIELCAFAARISRHPHLMLEWRQSWKDLSRYDKLREKFSSKKLFPVDQRELKQLYGPYDFCSKFVHPSVFSLSGHIEVANVSNGQTYNFLYSELKEGDPSEPVRTGIFILNVHSLILRAFEPILKTLKVKDLAMFSKELAVFQGEFLAFREDWRKVVEAE